MAGTIDHSQLDQECYLELSKRCTYKLDIKIIQHAIPKILQICYLGILAMSEHTDSKYWN